MKHPTTKTRNRDPERTREAILAAAAQEFAGEGMAGARMQRIARAARVNKALLHYYFGDKQKLHDAVLDSVFARLRERMLAVLARPLPPREKILAYAGAHFDFIAASPIYPRLVQQEMMRGGHGGTAHLRGIVRRYLRPVQEQVLQAMRAGIESGEFRPVSAQHFLFSMVAMNVFYFSSALFIGVLMRGDPLTPERVAERRAAVLDLISAALFASPVDSAGKESD